MEIIFSPNSVDDLNYWQQKRNTKVLQRIRHLIEDIQKDPFHGIGKPEPLRHNFSGMWSRRINQEHRLIYEITSKEIIIHSLKEHY